MRLIDADALYKEVENSLKSNPHSKAIQRVMHTHEHRHFQSMILNAPTIEAGYCKHCKYCDKQEHRQGVYWCNLTGSSVMPDDFCSYFE